MQLKIQDIPTRMWQYIGLVIMLMIGNVWLRNFAWQSSDQFHTLLEVSATLLALFVGGTALVCYYSQKNDTFLFIGTGFFGSALLDGCHAVVSSSWLAPYLPSEAASLAPWSWLASRLLLALLLSLSWLAWRSKDRLDEAGSGMSDRWVFHSTGGGPKQESTHMLNLKGDALLYLLVGGLTLITLCLFIFVRLPRAYYPELILRRPGELLPAFLFLIALSGYLGKGHWRHDIFEHWLVLSLIVGFISQALFMPFSGHLFDVMFDTAHVLKLVSYSFVLMGLLASMAHLFRRAEASIAQLGQANAALQHEIVERKQAQQALQNTSSELEQRVQERTAELLAVNESLQQEIAQRSQVEKDLTRQTEELIKSNAELEQFAYVASHDLQEPLRMVNSYVQLLQRRYQGQLDAEADKYIAYAVDGAARMKILINDLLSYSRVGTQGIPATPTNCEAVLERVLTILQPAIKENEAVVTYDQPLPTLMADETQLGQLFQNLISNALKFRNEAPPQIHISAEREASGERMVTSTPPPSPPTPDSSIHWLLTVRDNGIGIDPQFFERIFVIFQRLHGKQEYAGTGIGLAICKKIVERHKGRMWVASKPGQGSTFYFTLPGLAPEGAPPPPVEIEPPEARLAPKSKADSFAQRAKELI